MPKKNKKKSSEDRTRIPNEVEQLAHGLEDLLRTVRRIAHHEDDLCTLAHAARNHDESDADLIKDVSTLLKSMRTSDFNGEVATIEDALNRLNPKARKKTKGKRPKK